MIAGVKIKNLKVIPDERGFLMEILRRDDDIFEKFGQVYLTAVYPGVVKAWHYHKKQDDNLCSVKGMVKLVLHDPRQDSPTRGEVMEIFAGERNPVLVHVPAGVLHGFKGLGTAEALVLNCPTEPYNPKQPDEFRLPPHGSEVPYDWTTKDG